MDKYSDYDHPNSVCMSYGEHLCFSFELGLEFAAASMKAFIHGLIPECFITSSSDTVRVINKKINNKGCHNHTIITTENTGTNTKTKTIDTDIDLEMGGWHNIINGADK